MKKLFIVLMAALIAVSLAACTGGTDKNPTDAPITEAPATDVPVTEVPATDEPTAEPPAEPTAEVTEAPTPEPAYTFDETTRKFEDSYLVFTLPEDITVIAVTNAEPITSYSFCSPSYPANSDNIIYVVAPAAAGNDYSQKTADQILAEIKVGFDALGVEYSITNTNLEAITCSDHNGIIFSYDISMNGVTLHQMFWSVTTEDNTFNITATTTENVDAQRAFLDAVIIK